MDYFYENLLFFVLKLYKIVIAWEYIEMSENNRNELKQESNQTPIGIDVAQSANATMEQLIQLSLSKVLLNDLDTIVTRAIETAVQQAIQQTVNNVVNEFNQASHSGWQEHLPSLGGFKNFDERGLVRNNVLKPMVTENIISETLSPCPDPAIGDTKGPCKNPEPTQSK